MCSEDGGQTPRPDQAWLEQDASPGPIPPRGVCGSTEPPTGAWNRQRDLVLGAALAAVIAHVHYRPAVGWIHCLAGRSDRRASPRCSLYRGHRHAGHRAAGCHGSTACRAPAVRHVGHCAGRSCAVRAHRWTHRAAVRDGSDVLGAWWARMLLPGRPSNSAGWFLNDSIAAERGQFRIVVGRARFSLAWFKRRRVRPLDDRSRHSTYRVTPKPGHHVVTG